MNDRLGNLVEVGDVIRMVEIPTDFLYTLNKNEAPHIQEMLNNEYEIDSFTENGKASAAISWNVGKSLTRHGRLEMSTHEFEVVRKAFKTNIAVKNNYVWFACKVTFILIFLGNVAQFVRGHKLSFPAILLGIVLLVFLSKGKTHFKPTKEN